jgi:hypothetical protein
VAVQDDLIPGEPLVPGTDGEPPDYEALRAAYEAAVSRAEDTLARFAVPGAFEQAVAEMLRDSGRDN